MDKVAKEKMVNVKIKNETHRRLRSAAFFLGKDMQNLLDEILAEKLNTFDYADLAKSFVEKGYNNYDE